jgi:hypothetical protein
MWGIAANLHHPLLKKEKNMNDIVVQGLMWVAAGGLLVLYLKRRRNRKIAS